MTTTSRLSAAGRRELVRDLTRSTIRLARQIDDMLEQSPEGAFNKRTIDASIVAIQAGAQALYMLRTGEGLDG